MALLTPEQINGNKIVQVAFSVNDLRRAAHRWAENFGAGPFFVHDELPVTNVKGPAGEPGVFRQSVAFGQWGPLMVELIKWHTVEPDPVAQVFTQPGFNHIAYFSSDPEAEAHRLAAAGAPKLINFDFGSTPVHFHDGRDTYGFVIEQYPCSELVELTYRKVAEAAEGWDGSEPVRGPIEY